MVPGPCEVERLITGNTFALMEASSSRNSRSDGPCVLDPEEIFKYSNHSNGLIEMKLVLSDPKLQKKYKTFRVYRMSDDKRGRCLIINNYNFSNTSPRYGSDVDVKNLSEVFTCLGFHVIVEKDLASNEFADVIKKELENVRHRQYGMFAMIVMSHGTEGGKIFGTDNEAVNLHDLLKPIYNCTALRNKPKFIIVKACAGKDGPKLMHDNGAAFARVYADPLPAASNKEEKSALPEDVLILRSTFDGFVSIRHAYLGSPFIYALVEVLYKNSHNCDLETICKKVQNKMRNFNRNASMQKTSAAPLPSYNSFLRKKLYFFPGIISPGRNSRPETNIGSGTTTNSAKPISTSTSAAGTLRAKHESSLTRKLLTSSKANPAQLPSSIKYMNRASTRGNCHTVRWITDNMLATCTDECVELIDSNLNIIRSATLEGCLDVAAYNNELLILQSVSHGAVIKLYSQMLKKLRHFTTVPKDKYRKNIGNEPIRQIAAGGDKVCLSDSLKKCIFVWNSDGRLIKCIKIKNEPSGICITNDEHLLVCGSEGFVGKYALGGEYKCLWNSDSLGVLYAIGSSSNGLIYVVAGSDGLDPHHKDVLVLSAEGGLLNRITCDEPKEAKHAQSLSLSNDYLAVSCEHLGIKLFKFKYKQPCIIC